MVTGGEEKRLYRGWRVGGTNTTRCKIGYKDVLYNMGNLKNYIEKFKKNPFSFHKQVKRKIFFFFCFALFSVKAELIKVLK